MESLKKQDDKHGIALIWLIVVMIILVIVATIIMKYIFDLKTIGATQQEKLIPDDLIGKYVEYEPDLAEFIEVVQRGSILGTNENDKKFVTDTSLKWRVWSVDEEKITLISDKPTSIGGYKDVGALALKGCNGYNNCVKALNDICNTCYSNKELNSTARSLNVDDIENVLDKSVLDPSNYVNEKNRGYNIGERKEYTSNICFPYMYSLEAYSIIDDTELSEENGINRSMQYETYRGNSTYLKAKSKIMPMQTAWNNLELKCRNFINENYYYMLFRDGFSEKETLKSYFLASRAVDLEENCANFGIFEVSLGKYIKTNPLFNSRGGSLEYWDRIRPVVEIPIKNFELEIYNG